MKYWIVIILLIFVILNSPVTAQNKYIIKIATYAPGKSLWMKTMRKLSADILKKTDGKLKIIFYPDVIFKNDKRAIGYMKSGKLHGAALTGVGLGMIEPQLRIFEIPFLFSNHQELQKAEKKLSNILSKQLEKKDYILLGRCDQGFAYMMSDRKITTAGDLKKATIWVWKQDKLAYQIFDQLFKKVVPLEIKQVKSFLKLKKMDTVIMPVVPIIYLGWYHQLKYFIDIPIANVLGGIVMNKKIFSKLPKNYQILLQKQFAIYLARLNRSTIKLNKKAKIIFAKRGINIIKWDKKQSKILRHKTQQIIKKMDYFLPSLLNKIH